MDSNNTKQMAQRFDQFLNASRIPKEDMLPVREGMEQFRTLYGYDQPSPQIEGEVDENGSIGEPVGQAKVDAIAAEERVKARLERDRVANMSVQDRRREALNQIGMDKSNTLATSAERIARLHELGATRLPAASPLIHNVPASPVHKNVLVESTKNVAKTTAEGLQELRDNPNAGANLFNSIVGQASKVLPIDGAQEELSAAFSNTKEAASAALDSPSMSGVKTAAGVFKDAWGSTTGKLLKSYSEVSKAGRDYVIDKVAESEGSDYQTASQRMRDTYLYEALDSALAENDWGAVAAAVATEGFTADTFFDDLQTVIPSILANATGAGAIASGAGLYGKNYKDGIKASLEKKRKATGNSEATLTEEEEQNVASWAALSAMSDFFGDKLAVGRIPKKVAKMLDKRLAGKVLKAGAGYTKSALGEGIASTGADLARQRAENAGSAEDLDFAQAGVAGTAAAAGAGGVGASRNIKSVGGDVVGKAKTLNDKRKATVSTKTAETLNDLPEDFTKPTETYDTGKGEGVDVAEDYDAYTSAKNTVNEVATTLNDVEAGDLDADTAKADVADTFTRLDRDLSNMDKLIEKVNADENISDNVKGTYAAVREQLQAARDNASKAVEEALGEPISSPVSEEKVKAEPKTEISGTELASTVEEVKRTVSGMVTMSNYRQREGEEVTAAISRHESKLDNLLNSVTEWGGQSPKNRKQADKLTTDVIESQTQLSRAAMNVIKNKGTARDKDTAAGVVLRSLGSSKLTLKELKTLQKVGAVRNDEKSSALVGRAIETTSAISSLQSAVNSLNRSSQRSKKNAAQVSSEYLKGNPDRVGHYGLEEYLARATTAIKAGDSKGVQTVLSALDGWLDSGSDYKASAPWLGELRAKERASISATKAQIEYMRDNPDIGAKPAEQSVDFDTTGEAEAVKAPKSPKPKGELSVNQEAALNTKEGLGKAEPNVRVQIGKEKAPTVASVKRDLKFNKSRIGRKIPTGTEGLYVQLKNIREVAKQLKANIRKANVSNQAELYALVDSWNKSESKPVQDRIKKRTRDEVAARRKANEPEKSVSKAEPEQTKKEQPIVDEEAEKASEQNDYDAYANTQVEEQPVKQNPSKVVQESPEAVQAMIALENFAASTSDPAALQSKLKSILANLSDRLDGEDGSEAVVAAVRELGSQFRVAEPATETANQDGTADKPKIQRDVTAESIQERLDKRIEAMAPMSRSEELAERARLLTVGMQASPEGSPTRALMVEALNEITSKMGEDGAPVRSKASKDAVKAKTDSKLLEGKTLLDIVKSTKSKSLFTIRAGKSFASNQHILKNATVFAHAGMNKLTANTKVLQKLLTKHGESDIENQLRSIYKAVTYMTDRARKDRFQLNEEGAVTNYARMNKGNTGRAGSNPLTMFMTVGKDGYNVLNKAVEGTIALAGLNWLTTSGNDTIQRRMADTAKMFGASDYDSVSQQGREVIGEYSTKGLLFKLVANDIGKAAIQSLGAKFVADRIPARYAERLYTAAGTHALGLLVHAGLVETVPVNQKEYNKAASIVAGKEADIDTGAATVNFVRLTTVPNNRMEFRPRTVKAMNLFGDMPALAEGLMEGAQYQKSVTKEPASEITNKGARLDSTINKELVDSIKDYAETPFTFVESMKSIAQSPDAREILMTALGLDTFDETTVYEGRREEAKAVHENTIREMDSLLEAVQKDPSLIDSPFFMDSEIWVNHRNGNTNRDIGPQASKIHRALVTPEAQAVHVSAEDVTDGSTTEKLLITGLQTAFGIDEKSTEINGLQVMKDLTQQFGKNSKLSGVVRESFNNLAGRGTTVSAEDVHTVLGWAEGKGLKAKGLEGVHSLVEAYNFFELKAGRIEGYTARFDMEVDGVTNGFILLMMQFPVLGAETSSWLERGGVYTKEQYNNFNEFITKAGTLDSYEAMGKTMVETLQEQPEVTSFLNFIAGDLVKNEKVTKTVRNLIKPAFMIFNYGAGMKRIAGEARENLTELVYDKFEQIMLKGDQASLDELNAHLGLKGKNAIQLSEGLNTNEKLDKAIWANITLSGTEVNNIGSVYAGSITTAVEDHLGDLVPVRDTINQAFEAQWVVYRDVLDTSIADLEAKAQANSTEVSQAELDKLQALVEPYLPHVYAPTGERGTSERIMIFKTNFTYSKSNGVEVSYRTYDQDTGAETGTTSYSTQSLQENIISGGVSGFSIMVHAMDASIMARTYSAAKTKGKVYGKHDAVGVGIQYHVEASQELNRQVLHLLNDYSMVSDVLEGFTDSVQYLDRVGSEAVSLNTLGELVTKGHSLIDTVIQVNDKKARMFPAGGTVVVDQYPTVYGQGAIRGELQPKIELVPHKSIAGVEKVRAMGIKKISEIDVAPLTRGWMTAKNRKDAKAAFDAAVQAMTNLTPKKRLDTVADVVQASLTLKEVVPQVVAMLSELSPEPTDKNGKYRPLDAKDLAAREYLQAAINLMPRQVRPMAKPAPVKSAEIDVDVEGITKGETGTIVSEATLDALVDKVSANDTVELSGRAEAQLSKVFKDLIAPTLKHYKNVLVKFKGDVEGVGGNFGEIAGNTISMIQGSDMPNVVTQSGKEVLAHELSHKLTLTALLNDIEFRAQAVSIFDKAKALLEKNSDGTRNKTPWNMFLNHDSSGNVVYLTDKAEESAQAKAMYDYIFNNPEALTGADGATVGRGLVEFVAYGLTNPAMISKLSGMSSVAKHGTKSFNLTETSPSENLLVRLFNKLYAAVTKLLDKWSGAPEGSDMHQQLFNLALDINNTQNQSSGKYRNSFGQIFDKFGAGFDAVNKGVSVVTGGVSNFAGRTYKALTEPSDAQYTPAHQAVKLKQLQMQLLARGRSGEYAAMEAEVRKAKNPRVTLDNLLQQEVNVGSEGLVNSIADTVSGKVRKSGSNIQRTFDRMRTMVDRTREGTRSAVHKQVMGSFHNKTTQTEREAMTPVLMSSDISVLVNGFGFEEVQKMLLSGSTRLKESKALKQKLKAVADTTAYDGMVEQISGLGTYIAKGHVTKYNQMRSVAAIVDGLAYEGQGKVKDREAAVELVDQLISIEVLHNLDNSALQAVGRVWAREFESNATSNGITALVELQEAGRIESVKVFDNDSYSIQKGYTPQLYSKDIEIKQDLAKNAEEMKRDGWELQTTVNSRLGNTTIGIYTRRANRGAALVQGMIGYTNQSAAGTSITESYKLVKGSYSKKGIAKVKSDAARVYTKFAKGELKAKRMQRDSAIPLPIVNNEGKIVDYAYTMSETNKKDILKKNTDVADVMADLFASTAGKLNNNKMNEEAVNALIQDYDEYYTAAPESFLWVNGDEYSKHGTRNPYYDQYRMIPFEARKAIEAKWGKGAGIPIRKGMVRLVLGGRKYSVAESDLVSYLQEKFPNTPFGGIRSIASSIENLWQDIVRVGKVGVVIKTPAVVAVNMVSNLMVLATHRIDPVTASLDFAEGIRELRHYERLSADKVVLEAKLLASKSEATATNLRAKIVQIDTKLDASPIKAIIEEGMFQSIIEELDTTGSSAIDGSVMWANQKLEDKFGPRVTSAINFVPQTLFMGEKSTAFKLLNKATQYSDVVSRYSLVKRLTARNAKKPKDQQVSINEIYADAKASFINYNLPDHKGLDYANAMGALMFTKYYLGIQHVITRMWSTKPVEATASLLGQMAFGNISDVFDDSIINKNPISKMYGPTSHLDNASTMYGWELMKTISPL